MDSLDELCPTEIAYWAKNYVNILTTATHSMITLILAN